MPTNINAWTEPIKNLHELRIHDITLFIDKTNTEPKTGMRIGTYIRLWTIYPLNSPLEYQKLKLYQSFLNYVNHIRNKDLKDYWRSDFQHTQYKLNYMGIHIIINSHSTNSSITMYFGPPNETIMNTLTLESGNKTKNLAIQLLHEYLDDLKTTLIQTLTNFIINRE